MATKRKSDSETSEAKRFESQEYLTLLELLLSHTSLRIWIELSYMSKATREHLPRRFLIKVNEMTRSPELYFTALQLCQLKYITEYEHHDLLLKNGLQVESLVWHSCGHNWFELQMIPGGVQWCTEKWSGTIRKIVNVEDKIHPGLLALLYVKLPSIAYTPQNICFALPFRHYRFIPLYELASSDFPEYSGSHMTSFAKSILWSDYDHQGLLLQLFERAAFRTLDFGTLEGLFECEQLRGEFFSARIAGTKYKWPELKIRKLERLARLVKVPPKIGHILEPEVMAILDEKFEFDNSIVYNIAQRYISAAKFLIGEKRVPLIGLNSLFVPRLVKRTLHEVFCDNVFFFDSPDVMIIEWTQQMLTIHPEFKEHIDFFVCKLASQCTVKFMRGFVGRVYYPNVPPRELLKYGPDMTTDDHYTVLYNCLCSILD